MRISLDGFTSGPNQRLDAPFGDGVGDRLHRWMFETPEENEAVIASLTGMDATAGRLAGLGLDLVATRGSSLAGHLTYRVLSPPPA